MGRHQQAAAASTGAPRAVAATAATLPTTSFAPPPGWKVLGAKGALPTLRRAGGGTGAAAGIEPDPAADVRAVLAADAWAAEDDCLQPSRHGERQAQVAGVGGMEGGRRGVGKGVRAAAAVGEPQPPGRGPALDLAKATLWSALADEEGVSNEEEGNGGAGSVRGSGQPLGPAKDADGAGEGGESWEDVKVEVSCHGLEANVCP